MIFKAVVDEPAFAGAEVAVDVELLLTRFLSPALSCSPDW